MGSEPALAILDAAIAAEAAPPAGAEQRVWRAIAARQKKRVPLGWTLGFAAAAAVAVACALALSPRGPAPTPTRAPALIAAERSSDGRLGAPGVIDLHGAARLVTSEGCIVRVVEDDEHGLVLELERGSVLAEVKPRPVAAPLRVRTPRAEVRVVGTVLWVAVDEGGAATVAVGHGAVEVTPRGGAVVRVRAGERWPSASKRAPAKAEIERLGAAEGPLAWSDETDAAPSAAPPLPPTTLPSPGAAAPSAVAKTTAECRTLRGAAASQCLERLAAGDDPLRAESALFEIGWRRLREANDPRGALAAWETQRTRFPSGVLRADADVSIIEALGRAGDPTRARGEIDAWLAAHPDGLAAPQVHYLRGALDRRAGDCRSALRELDLALSAPAAPWAADARAERAACQRRGR